MHHPTTVEFMVRGDTGVDGRAIRTRLAELGDGETVAWKRYDMLGGGDITVTRRGEQFEVTGQTKLRTTTAYLQDYGPDEGIGARVGNSADHG